MINQSFGQNQTISQLDNKSNWIWIFSLRLSQSSNYKLCDPRYEFINKPPSQLGIGVMGGNATGIFVRDIQPDSKAHGHLRPGDQILEVNYILCLLKLQRCILRKEYCVGKKVLSNW